METPTDDREVLMWFIETSTEAMDVLQKSGFTGDRMKAVADVLRGNAVPQPPSFPCSSACIKYGRAIAKHILEGGEP
jgi:hypothetical protein